MNFPPVDMLLNSGHFDWCWSFKAPGFKLTFGPLPKKLNRVKTDVVMAGKTSFGRGRFSNFSIAKLLEKGSKAEERGEKEEVEEEGGEGDELVDEEHREIKQEKIELLGGAELSG